MKKINIQKIILVLIPVLFIFSGVSKADTFTYLTNPDPSKGDAGYNDCYQCQYTFLLQTDKPIYTENSNGGGDTVTVISSSYIGPPSSQVVWGGNYDIQQNNYGQFTTLLTSGSNDSYSFQVGTDSNGNPSYWDVNRNYRVRENLTNFFGGNFIVNFNGTYDSSASYDLVEAPYVWFTLQPGSGTSTTTCTATSSTSVPANWRSVQVGLYHYISGSSNGYDYQYNGAGTKYVTYLDISPNSYNGNSFFLWNQYSTQTSSLPSTIDLSTASYSGSSITDLFNSSKIPCSAYSGLCVDYDYFAANDGFYETLWYFPDGIHTTQQNPLVDLSNSELSESNGYVGGNQPSSVGSANATTGNTSTTNTCSKPPSIFSK